MQMFKRTAFFTTIALFVFFSSSFAQTKKVTPRANLRFGANYAFQGGTSIGNLFNPDFTFLQGTAFLGYRFDPKKRTANYIGVFATMGGLPQPSLNQMKVDNAIALPVGYNGQKATALEFEGGFIFGDWFRISAGPGLLNIPLSNGSQKQLRYYSGTAGLIVKMGGFNVNTSAGMQFGGDFLKPTYRVSVGAGFSFSFFNFRKK
jgi:hypothetical protein